MILQVACEIRSWKLRTKMGRDGQNNEPVDYKTVSMKIVFALGARENNMTWMCLSHKTVLSRNGL